MSLRREACNSLLYSMIGNKDLVKAWWDSPNKAFNGETPNSIFETEPKKVYNYLMSCAEGEW